MNEKDAMEWLKDISNFSTYDMAYVETLLQLLKLKDKRIDELESELYNVNKIIDDYIEERNKLKDKMIGDKMEQFDDYVIYLIESYLEIMGE